MSFDYAFAYEDRDEIHTSRWVLDGVQTRAAERLGMTFRSFRYFAKKYGLTSRGADGQTEREPELVGAGDREGDR